MTKPNKDGWIRHRGKIKPPVEPGTVIDVRYRNGDIDEGDEVGEDEEWLHEGSPYDVMAWRLHKPSILDQPGEPNEALKEVLELDSPKISSEPDVLIKGLDSPSLYIQQVGRTYRAEGDPRKMRDRIREIDAAIAAMADEHSSLVAKLAAEGFALIQGDEPNVAVESAQQDIVQQDMSDPANWRVGDVVEIVESSNSGWVQFKGMVGRLENDGDWFISFDPGCWYVSDNTEVKWHSRPT